MKILVIDACSSFLDFCLRADEAGHEVRSFLPKEQTGEPDKTGDGLIDKVSDWKPWMKWADMIILEDNVKYAAELEPFFEKGFPIFGCNRKAAELELDRELGQKVLEREGIECLPYKVFSDYDAAIHYVEKEKKAFVSKPWGGTADKSLSYVPDSPEALIFQLERWKRDKKVKGDFILQEKVDGMEMAVGGWFGPGGWSRWLCENWEEKKQLNGGLGVNTIEQGTTLRYVNRSKLFDELLDPVTDYLHELNYVGYVDMNAIVAKMGQPWPLEFTMRFGNPTWKIQMALHQGDPANWMGDLLDGKDTLRVSRDVAVGVVLSHGDYPHSHMTGKEVQGFPIYGLEDLDHIHFCEVMDGEAPHMVGGEIKWVKDYVTSGDLVLVTTGTGKTVSEAADAAYDVAWKIKFPSNKGMRTDISERLKNELPLLQKFGYAKGMSYGSASER